MAPNTKPEDELTKEMRSANKIDRARASMFESLLKTEAWKEYVELIDALIQNRADQVMMPAGSVDGAIALEHVKGAMSGLIMARDIPSVTIAAMQQLRSERVLDAGDDDDDNDLDD